MVVLHFENDHPLEDAGEPLRPREDDRSCERSGGRRPETTPSGPRIGAANARGGESGEAPARDSRGSVKRPRWTGPKGRDRRLDGGRAHEKHAPIAHRSPQPRSLSQVVRPGGDPQPGVQRSMIADRDRARRGLNYGPGEVRLRRVTRRQRAVGSGAALRSGPCHLRGMSAGRKSLWAASTGRIRDASALALGKEAAERRPCDYLRGTASSRYRESRCLSASAASFGRPFAVRSKMNSCGEKGGFLYALRRVRSTASASEG